MAGYSEHTAAKIGSENLQKPDVIAFIKSLERPIAQHQLDSIEGRRKWLQDMIGSDTDVAGNPVRAAERLKAIEMLAKMGGDFIERKHITGEIQLGFQAYVPKKGSK